MRILVVDDEEPIREGMSAILVKAGHEVELASDDNEAIQLYDERGPYDVVLTDMLHPGPNGLELKGAGKDEAEGRRRRRTSGGQVTGGPAGTLSK